jgi:lipase
VQTTSHVHQFGPADGRPLLALHGIFGHGTRWRRFAEDQLPGFRVIAPDLRGHGRTTWDPPWRFEQYVADIVEVLDDLGLDRVPVLGHSFGGAIALHLSVSAPARVDRLVLVDPAIGLYADMVIDGAEEACDVEPYATIDEARAAQAERWPFASAEQLDDELRDGFAQDSGGRWRHKYARPVAVAAWSEMARAHVVPPAGTPTLLVPALRADFVTPEFAEALREALGDNLTVREIDSSHMIYHEKPAELGKLVTDFLG